MVLDAVDLKLLDLLQDDATRSNQWLAEQVHVSPPTCLRRVRRLHECGLIERQVAIVQPERLAGLQGQQCGRVSPGPDFVLVLHTHDMPAYLALAQRLFTGDANVRNVKAFFATKRAKFLTKVAVTPVK